MTTTNFCFNVNYQYVISRMNNLHSSSLIAAAIGATIGLIGAASIFIFQKIIEDRQHTQMYHDFDNVNQRIAEMQAELEQLRAQQRQNKKKRKGMTRKNISTDSTCTVTENDIDIDAFSIATTDVGDDEFFDCSDSEDIADDNELRTTEAMNDLELVLADFDEHNVIDKELGKSIYSRLRNLAYCHPENAEVIWRFCKACSDYSTFVSDFDTKKRIFLEGIIAAEKILTVQNADLHKWYAKLKGLYVDFLPVADKIKNGYVFREHINTALELRPDDPELHYLLGRFKYEVSGLSWMERTLASALFGTPPNSSYEDAICSFERAEELATKPLLSNRLFLSKSYIALNQYEKAFHWLDKIFESSAITTDDQEVQAEARELRSKYLRYST